MLAFFALGPEAYERVALWESTVFHRLALLAFVLLFASAFLGGPTRHLRLDLEKEETAQGLPDRLRSLARLVAGLHLAFLFGLALLFAKTGPGDLWGGPPPALQLLLALPLLAILPTAALLYAAARALHRQEGTPAGLVRLAAVTLAALAFYPFLAFWNLLGWRL